MLQSIVLKDLNFKFITISDNAVTPSDAIFNSIVHSLLNNTKAGSSVHIICTERSAEFYNAKFASPSAKFIDACSISQYPFKSASLDDLLNSKNPSPGDVVIFDSINSFLWDQPVHTISQQIVELSKRVEKIVLRVHVDVLCDKNDAILLQHLCKQSCHIEMMEKMTAGHIVRVTQSKPIKRQLELCRVDENGKIHSEVYSEKAPPAPPRVVPMDTLTTFDLGVKLSQSEKEARDRLVLPYLRTSEDTGAQIDYEADEADLEEDPDDDLEL